MHGPTFMSGFKFFFTDFHKGTVNIVLHIVSFSIMFYGIWVKDLILALLGLAVIDECGHLYNYFILHKKDPKYNPIKMLPYQFLITIPVLALILGYFDLL